MSERSLHEMLRAWAADVPAPDLAHTTWARAQRIQRRRRGAAVASAALVGVVAALIARGGIVEPRADAPAAPSESTERATTTPTAPTDEGPSITLDASDVQEGWNPARWADLAWADTPYPRSFDPAEASVSPLSGDPVQRALFVMQQSNGTGAGVYIFADDGRWRLLDGVPIVPADDGAGYGGPAIRPTSLSPDGTRLALPQPGALLVVDLTQATAQKYGVPGFPTAVVWTADGRQVLVSDERRDDGLLVSLADGVSQPVPYHALRTVFTAPGTALELMADSTGLKDTLRTYPASGTPTTVPLGIEPAYGFYEVMPFSGGDLIATLDEVNNYDLPMGPEDRSGIVVVDGATGEALAKLPTERNPLLYGSTPLGWLDSTRLLVRFDHYVLVWDYVAGTLERVGEFPLAQRLTFADLG